SLRGRHLTMVPVHGLALENVEDFRAAWRDSLGQRENADDARLEERLFGRLLYRRMRFFLENVNTSYLDSVAFPDTDIEAHTEIFPVISCTHEHAVDSVARAACRAGVDENGNIARIFYRPSREFLERS